MIRGGWGTLELQSFYSKHKHNKTKLAKKGPRDEVDSMICFKQDRGQGKPLFETGNAPMETTHFKKGLP